RIGELFRSASREHRGLCLVDLRRARVEADVTQSSGLVHEGLACAPSSSERGFYALDLVKSERRKRTRYRLTSHERPGNIQTRRLEFDEDTPGGGGVVYEGTLVQESNSPRDFEMTRGGSLSATDSKRLDVEVSIDQEAGRGHRVAPVHVAPTNLHV